MNLRHFFRKHLVAFGIIASALLIAGSIARVQAQGILMFGGFVTVSIPCTCSGNFLLTILGPAGGQFTYHIGTPQFLFHQLPRTGVWTLGVYSPGGVCLMWAGKICVPTGIPIGTITPLVGTSLTP